MAENYCVQQLRDTFDTSLKYYVQSPTSEIDLIVQNDMEIIPMEIKAGNSLKSNSFKKYISEYVPKQAIRFSAQEYIEQECVINVPLYLVGKVKEMMRE
jgi:Holliday junction resolvase-like predicted endonuclease